MKWITRSRWFKSLAALPAVKGSPRPYPVDPLLCLLPLGLIFDSVGYLPPCLRLLLLYLLLAVPLGLAPSRRSAWGGAGLLAVVVLIGFIKLPVIAEIFLLLLAHQCVWAAVGLPPARLLTGIAFYAVAHVVLFMSPLGYPVLEGIATVGRRITAWVTGNPFHVGYTYQNVGAFLLFLCLSLFGWDRTAVSKARTACYLVVAVLLNSVLGVVLMEYVDFGADFTWKLLYRDVFSYPVLLRHLRDLILLAFPAVMFVAYAVAYVLLHHEGLRPGQPAAGDHADWRRPAPRQWRQNVAAVLLAIMALWMAVPATIWRRPHTSRLVLVERGVVSFSRPVYGRYGRAAGGMYGMLPDYAKLFGCGAVVVPDVPESLASDDTLVLTNLDEPLDAAVHQRIWDFVAAGGRLWVLGDHTFIKNGRNHVNDLLAPCHIRLKHDSAQFFPQGWFHSYRFRQGTPFGDLKDSAENRPAILVGASLELHFPAQPFIMGRFGYSDWGTSESDEQRGYIGDFEYQPEERLGDLVLVAGEPFGKGKVLVYGDTTSFFNNNLGRSHAILRSSLSWLGERRSCWRDGSSSMRVALAAVMVLLFVVLVTARSVSLSFWLAVTVALGSAIAHRSSGLLPWAEAEGRARMAIMDFSHAPYASKHSSMDSGLHGVSINLMRHGLLPICMDEWDPLVLDHARLVVFNAPRRRFRAAERRQLNRFMQRGGTIVVACGFPHYESCRALLEPMGVRVRGLPLGRFFDREALGRRVSFLSAWPLELSNPAATVLCAYDDWPLMTSVAVGRGKMIVIGDSEFLHNRNLEGIEKFDPANIEFVRALLDHAVGEVSP